MMVNQHDSHVSNFAVASICAGAGGSNGPGGRGEDPHGLDYGLSMRHPGGGPAEATALHGDSHVHPE